MPSIHPEQGRQARLAAIVRAGDAMRSTADPLVIGDIAAKAASAALGGGAAHCKLLIESTTLPADAAHRPGADALRADVDVDGRKVARLVADRVDPSLPAEEAQWLLDALAAHAAAAFADAEADARRQQAFSSAVEAGLGQGEQRRRTFSTMGHDIRSPLASLQIGCNMLQRMLSDQVTPDLREILAAMVTAAKQASAMADNLVELGRLEKGVNPVVAETVDVEPMIEKALDDVAARAEEAGVTLHRRGVAAGQAIADPARMPRVLSNLLLNAIDFSPEGGTVTLSTARFDGRLHLAVTDQGPGIAPEHQPAIFEPFFQAREQHGHKPGLGLGLAVSRELVHRMNGGLTVESQPGEGATFTLTLNEA